MEKKETGLNRRFRQQFVIIDCWEVEHAADLGELKKKKGDWNPLAGDNGGFHLDIFRVNKFES